jgi:hypothetical protein
LVQQGLEPGAVVTPLWLLQLQLHLLLFDVHRDGGVTLCVSIL